MLLSITTKYQPATDIGFLLHKNPQNLHTISLSFGTVYVFYPEVSLEKCTVAILVEVDPIALTRKKNLSSNSFALKPYVNDFPYVSSSLMSVAINKAFGTLLSGRSKHRQELVNLAMPFEVKLPVIRCSGGKELLYQLFEPLGYEVTLKQHVLDSMFSNWGNSPYYTVELKNNCTLRELLIHLYVLIPVLDNNKHYWISESEINKLVKYGEGWLPAHPEKNLITKRYLKNFKPYINVALERLSENNILEYDADESDKIKVTEELLERNLNLNQQRLDWVLSKLKDYNVRKVIDLGCGEGNLLIKLLKDKSIDQITGCDISLKSLEIAENRLKIDDLPDIYKNKVNLFQSSLTYNDKRFYDYDAATLIEVIEHMNLDKLDFLKLTIFKFAKPGIVIITTPNVEYNSLFENLAPGKLRHNDHRFEWTRAQFANWSSEVAHQFNYSVTFYGIGNQDEQYGSPTQVGVFIKNVN
ncbi:MAG: 3' terminal RNA ribose 2'-O-methyltransferase Hen1 [Neisseriaceae bacterium]